MTQLPIKSFKSWTDFKQHIENIDLGPIFNGCGIFKNKENVLFLRSVDGTSFYDDKFDHEVMYTFYGQIGDQDPDDRYNKHIVTGKTAYLYRVQGKTHMWYGKVKFGQIKSKLYQDRNGNLRTIYRVKLQ